MLLEQTHGAGLLGVVQLRRGTGAVIVGEAVLAVLGVGVDPGRDGVAVNREDYELRSWSVLALRVRVRSAIVLV